MTFDDLAINTPLRNSIADLGYVNPTPIQREAFNVILSGKDVVGVAQTGTGKTFAYLIPILRNWKYSKQIAPRTVIVVPTRELVLQIVGEIEKLAKYMNVRFAGVYGGTNINTQKYVVLEGLDILVATPGRLVDLALHGALKLKSVRQLVIDEVDEMLNLGFRIQLMNILDLLPERRQNLLFSATLSEEVQRLVDDFFSFPVKIEVAAHGTPLDKIIQKGYAVPNFNTKVNLLKHLLQTDADMQKVLVFMSTKKLADRLFEIISPDFGENIGIIHSNKSQNFRIRTVEAFHEGKHRILIATDIIARGIDVSEVTHVINFHLPEVAVNYIHRIGRTGRAEKAGQSISFISEKEQELQLAIVELMNRLIPIENLPEEVEVSKELWEEEKASYNQKDYLPKIDMSRSQGAFHDKKLKNTKVNRAKQKRQARMEEKRKSRRRGPKQ